jgi:predicted transcriptional regulator of viral defense system
MNYLKISRLSKFYFSYRDIAKARCISLPSARVALSRLVKSGSIIRLKRGLYVLAQRLNYSSLEEKFLLANLIQPASYISFMTALSFYEVTTQLQRNFIESAGYLRTKEVEAGGNLFNYVKIKKDIYFGFIKTSGYFIATPEKAFLDAFYLKSLKRYNFDLASINFKRLNKDKLFQLSRKYPLLARKLLLKYGYIKKA